MTCDQVKLFFIDYLESELDPEIENSVKGHLETCKHCNDEVQKYKTLFYAIDKNRMELPDPSLKENFLTMLQAEINVGAVDQLLKPSQRKKTSRAGTLTMIGLAACFSVFGFIYFTGNPFNKNRVSTPSISISNQPADYVNERLIFDLLQAESASDRILALTYAAKFPNPGQRLINTLISTVNKDGNANVRVEAFNVVSKYLNNRAVQDSLISSLGRQTEPIVQIMMIIAFTDLNEPRLIDPIRTILQDKRTIEPVRAIAEDRLKMVAG